MAASSEFLIQAKDLRERFQKKGCPDKLLRDCFKQALSRERSTLLSPKPRNTEDPITRIIRTYDEAATPIREILRRHWGILQLDPDLREIIGPRPQITYRKGPSLRDRLIKSHFELTPDPPNWLLSNTKGCYCCSGCVACTHIQIGRHFTSHIQGRRYEIKFLLNCKFTFVVYKADCKCGKEYVGITIHEFRRCVGEHYGDICHKRDTPLSRHMWSCQNGNISDLKFMAIDHIRPNICRGNRHKTLLQKETFWIFTLRTMFPQGLNEQLQFNCFI